MVKYSDNRARVPFGLSGHADGMAEDFTPMPDWMREVRDLALRRMECLGCGEALRGKGFVQKGGIVACCGCRERLAQELPTR